MSDDDPIRWADGGGPPGALELVRAIARTPAVPSAMRSSVVRSTGPLRMVSRTRMVGGAVATAMVLGGLALWVWPRPHEPIVREPAAVASSAEATHAAPPLVGQSAPVAVTPPVDAVVPPSVRVRRPAAASPVTPDAPPAVAAPLVAEAPTGYLTLNSSPWSQVFIDGNDAGHNTPVLRLRVSAGQHSVRFKTPDGATVETTVDVQAGQTTTIVRQLDPGTAAADRLERARQMMLAGNNTGVIALLQGARSQQELELLIATYTNIGNTTAKLAAMQRYIERFPTTPRARQYEQVLMRQARPSAIDEDE